MADRFIPCARGGTIAYRGGLGSLSPKRTVFAWEELSDEERASITESTPGWADEYRAGLAWERIPPPPTCPTCGQRLPAT